MADGQGQGFEYPPDAGDSALGAWGLQNPTVLWAIRTGQADALALTPKSFQGDRGSPPLCPDEECRRPMHRRPPTDGPPKKPMRWVCYHARILMGDDEEWYYAGGFTVELPVDIAERAPKYHVLDKLDQVLEEERDPWTGKRVLKATPLEQR